jgi:two-component system, NtrC family, sensor histidine kinase HydH
MPADREKSAITWIDIIWLVFLLGLALLPPLFEIHKQLTLLAIGIFQFFEGKLVARLPKYGAAISVVIKIILSTLLLEHTGELGINSSYYPIFYLPVVDAAIAFGPVATLAWTTLASLAYVSLLIPALEEYELTAAGITVLAIRVLFFYIAAILVNRFVMENRGQVTRLQALSSELEETNRQLRRAEAEARRAERLAALGQLSAGLAHEIRNPLGVIKGSSEMLNQKLTGSQPLIAELAGFISSEVDRLNGLVGRFLDFARPSRLQLRAERISDVVNGALESVRAQYPNARVEVERQYTPGLPEIQLDRQLCEQVFINLITNAFQAMNGQDGTLRLSIVPETAQGVPGVTITVEDSGPGVPAELREQIFNPFFTSKKEGVGLGLSIVAKIVDDHRGTIRLDPDTTRGARFRVFLPQAQET